HEDTGMMGQFIVNAAASGTTENAAQQHVQVSPTLLNTGQETVRISADSDWEPVRVEVFDQLGRLLLTQPNGTDIHANQLASGMNLLKIYTVRGTAIFKIVKIN